MIMKEDQIASKRIATLRSIIKAKDKLINELELEVEFLKKNTEYLKDKVRIENEGYKVRDLLSDMRLTPRMRNVLKDNEHIHDRNVEDITYDEIIRYRNVGRGAAMSFIRTIESL